VKIRSIKLLICCVVAHGLVVSLALGDDSATKSGMAEPAKTLAKLSRLVGGTWVNQDPKFVVESRYEWAFGNKVIRGLGTTGKGSPLETPIEAFMGLDPVKKTVFYLDCHGGDSVYQGSVTLEGDDVIFEFATIVGPPAKWHEVLRFTDADTMEFTIFAEKDGKWSPVVTQISKRRQPKSDAGQLVSEGIIDAPVDAVWAAFTTKEGQESWNVAHAEIDLRVGGKMRTHYDPKGRLGDPNTIENVILSFEPNHMLSIQVGNPPENFPFKNAIKKVWTVIRLDEVGPSRTKLTVTGLGYGDDEDSRKLRGFFDKGNSYTIKKLQEKFAAPGAKPAQSG
jgi:uncharacterized protein YndB with AHSA1/START domain